MNGKNEARVVNDNVVLHASAGPRTKETKHFSNGRYALVGTIALLTFLIYLPALRNGFIELDDAAYILDNPYIRSFNLNLFRWAFFQFYAANWHPLTWISHALDYALWGLNPLGHHLTNIILHTANTALVVVLTLRLLEIVQERTTQNRPASFLNNRAILVAAGVTGLLFGTHPVHVESVAWVSERKDLLCALFFLLSIMTYVKTVKRMGHGAEGARLTPRVLFPALCFFVLALLSKPMAVSLPAVLLILDWYPFGRIQTIRAFRVALVEKLPFIALSLVSSIFTILAQKSGEALVSTQLVSPPERLLVAVKALLSYIGEMVLPYDLVPYYPYPGLREISLSRAEYLIPVLLLMVITAVVSIKAAKRENLWLAALLYYVIALLPVLGIVQVGGQAMADRYTYLPSLGPFLLAGVAGAWVYGRVNAGYPRLANGMGFTVAVMVFSLLSILTARQIGIWKDSMAVFDAILAKESRRSPMVYFHRGVAYEKSGNLERAVDDYTRAITLFPQYYEAFFSRGTTYDRLGKSDFAIEDYDVAISLKPSSYEAYTNRGLVFKKIGRRNEAAADFERAAALSTSAGKAHFNLGIIRFEDGRLGEAIEQFSLAIATDPMDAEAYGNRGIAYAVAGQTSAALKDFDKAVELRSDFAVIYYNRGKLYASSGLQERAFADYQKACQLGDEISCLSLRELSSH